MAGRPSPLRKTEALRKAVEPLVRKFGNIPPAEVLIKRRKWKVYNAIVHFHGGYRKAREKLGLPEWEPKNSVKKFKDLEKLRELAEPAIRHFGGTIPGGKLLLNEDYAKLVYAAQKFHGGIMAARKKLGVPRTLLARNEMLSNDVRIARNLASNRELFDKLLSALDPRHEAVLRARLGLAYPAEKGQVERQVNSLIAEHGNASLAQIGGVFGLSRERASQLNKRALASLKDISVLNDVPAARRFARAGRPPLKPGS